MTKIIKCSDVGFDCQGVIKAETEQEAMQMAAQHAKEAHGVDTISPEIKAKIQSVMITE